MKISIGCDHIVTEIKDHLVKYLEARGHEVTDNGTYDKKRTHYPVYGVKTAKKLPMGTPIWALFFAAREWGSPSVPTN